jgi:hypothetical protein
VKDKARTLREFFDEFIEHHRISNGEAFELLVTDEDCMRLGEFFIRGMVGWASGYDLVREMRADSSRVPLAGIVVEDLEPEEEKEVGEDKTFVH